MNKTELFRSVAEKSGLSLKGAEAAVNALIDVVTEALEAGDKVQLIGFGSFEVKHRPERRGRNPKTKEEIVIPACGVVKFSAGKKMKQLVNSSK